MTDDLTTGRSETADMTEFDEREFARQVLDRIRQQRRHRRLLLAGAWLVAITILLLALLFAPAAPGSLATIGAAEILALLFLLTACCLGWLIMDSRPAGRSDR